MKTRKFTIFRRIGILVFTLISGLCLLFMVITYFTTKNFHEASTQLLNKDVAAHIAEFTSPFTNDGINKRKADSVFKDAMVISPSAEVYFLDTAGKVIAFHPNEKEVRLWQLPLKNINRLIASNGQDYITGPDPRDPSNPKIFSAAKVKGKSKDLGYIYVILGSNKNVTNMLYTSYFGSLLVKVFFVIIVLSIIFSLVYLNRIQKSFNRMISVLERFQDGDLEARLNIKENEEFAPVTTAFNKMADLLVYNIDRLTKSEKDRKDFIANISHDLRTPLSIARGYTETLLMKNEKQVTQQQQEEFLQLVHRKLGQVEHMVKQLFDLSKMESAELVPNKEPFVPSEIVQEIIHTYQLTAGEKKVSLKCTQCQYHVWVNADIAMMERVFQNLIDNAIKNTLVDGEIQVSIVVSEKDLVFTIENSGSSIPADILNWINDSKDDGSFSGSRPAKVGLGLLIVKKILHLHQYFFKAESNAGIGNRFTIIMPVVQGAPYNFAA